MSEDGMMYPGGARFAFTIIDDTDVATRANVEPIYDLFRELGMRTTKTVWPVPCPEGSKNFHESETLEDESYLEFVRTLAADGFEITWHGATMESSSRERTRDALERFRDLLGSYPAIHVNHAFNRENLYWGRDRIDSRWIRALLGLLSERSNGYFTGHDPTSEFWWGDLARRHIRYARNLTFDEINTLRLNPSMPYHDPRRPLVRRWFSGTDAEGVEEFNALLCSLNQDRLEREGGACIVATHLGKGFAENGIVNAETRNRLQELTGRKGWFPPAGELLDWLRDRQADPTIPRSEWNRMQRRWFLQAVKRRLGPRGGRRKHVSLEE